jgi:transmembrane sensor
MGGFVRWARASNTVGRPRSDKGQISKNLKNPLDAPSPLCVIAPNREFSPMDRIKYLLLLVLREEANSEERAELEAWAAGAPANRELIRDLQDPDKVAEALATLDQMHRAEAWAKVEGYAAAHRPAPVATLDDRRSGRRRIIFRWMAAAVIAVLVGTGTWWLIQNRSASIPPVAQTAKTADIAAPARNRAMITLAGGQQVYLDSAGTGALAQQGNAQVVKEANGRVTYKVGNITNRALLFNTLSNPRGSQVVNLTLSDGTKVWLNAESSLRYPVIFAGGDRTVEVNGEAYFEVKKNLDQPFIVEVKNGAKIEVLGTAFNVNVYPDEPDFKATLLEGSVRVSMASVPGVVLKPGQQAQIVGLKTGNGAGNPSLGIGQISVLNNVDTEAVMAWKNGRFAFDDADLPTVMRQLARWYDIDVTYDGNIPKREFNGKIGKMLTLDQLLKVLTTTTRFHYSIEGNKLAIRP